MGVFELCLAISGVFMLCAVACALIVVGIEKSDNKKW